MSKTFKFIEASPTKHVYVRLDQKMYNELKQIAGRENCTLSEVLRTFIVASYEEYMEGGDE